MSKETLAKSIREIPDFPIPGILFYDVTTLFKDPQDYRNFRTHCTKCTKTKVSQKL